MENILITGASGFLGRALINHLSQYYQKYLLICGINTHLSVPIPFNHSNIILTPLNISNAQEVKKLFDTYEIHKIIHLAAIASPYHKNYDIYYDVNIKGTHNLLEHCQKNTDFIFTSSITVYGDSGSYYESDKLNPLNLYSISKVACEQLIRMYEMSNKIRPRILRLGVTVGPNMTHGKLFEAQKQNKLTLYGKSPGNFNTICYISDVVQAITKTLEFKKPNLLANICNNDVISLEETLNIINPNIKLTWQGDDKPKVLLGYTNVANYELNWEPKFTSIQSLYKMKQEKSLCQS